jgi:hypothetical protein
MEGLVWAFLATEANTPFGLLGSFDVPRRSQSFFSVSEATSFFFFCVSFWSAETTFRLPFLT